MTKKRKYVNAMGGKPIETKSKMEDKLDEERESSLFSFLKKAVKKK